MTTVVGNSGVVKVGAAIIKEVVEFSIDESAQMVEDSELTDAWDTFKAGSRRWKGSLTVHLDPTDTAGQELLVPGQTVSLLLYPFGSGVGNTYYTGSAVIESRGVDVKRNGVVERQISFQGSGAFTQGTA